MDVALAANASFLDLDDGWPLLQVALTETGFDAQVVIWDDPTIDWAPFDLVVAVYAWGYVTRRPAFLTWAGRVDALSTLANSADHLRWNTDKRYLGDLAAVDIPVVPTTWAPPGERWDLPAGDSVVKPTVASGGLGAAHYRAGSGDAADAHVRRLHRSGQTAMVQPYQRSVDSEGETALVYFGADFSHAVKKSALLVAGAGEQDRLWEQQVIAPTEPRPSQRRLAETVLEAVAARFGPTAYARIDLVDDENGRPQVLEVELVEPSLFLATAPGSAARFAHVLRRLVSGSRTPP